MDTPPLRSGCPIDHGALRQQKTAQTPDTGGLPIERDAAGVWHVRDYDQAHAILQSTDTKQAGFKADLLEQVSPNMVQSILYLEGKPHHEQRRQTARFFTPKTVSEKYRQLMERFADRLVEVLQQRKQIDLSVLSMKMAVRVAAQVVGLTNSRLPGMDRRLNSFFNDEVTTFSWHPRALLEVFKTQTTVSAFFFLDVKPAIQARRREPGDDVISYLIGIGYTDPQILIECLTYAAAGMVTTREFIGVATWHLLEQPELRARYLASNQEERHAILHEVLRLEPVVAHLYRRTTAELTLDAGEERVTIPQNSLINLHVNAINADGDAVGDNPDLICPGRELASTRIGAAAMSFGDGHHRCPGSYIAIQETDILLQRLLALPNLQLVRKPSVSWNDVTAGYELRDFVIAVA